MIFFWSNGQYKKSLGRIFGAATPPGALVWWKSVPSVGPVKISTEYLAQIETAISIIYGKYVYTYGYVRVKK